MGSRDRSRVVSFRTPACSGSLATARMNTSGHLLNAYIAAGNQVHATANGEHYMDVGTMEGYHNAQDYLRARSHKIGEQQSVSAA